MNRSSKALLISVAFLSLLSFSQFVMAHGATYHKKEDLIAMFKALADAHPSYASYESLGKSILGKDIWLFKIGRNSLAPRVLFDGSMHGWEDIGSEIEYLYAKWLLESSDTAAKNIRERSQTLIVPIVNIDSYERQNMRRSYTYPNGGKISIPYGVDLNRNFVYGWGQTGSGDPYNNFSYRGPAAGSEPETKALRKAMSTYRPRFYLNTHMGGGPYLAYWSPVANSNLHSQFLLKVKSLSSQFGVTQYTVKALTNRGGEAIADAQSYGASAWLLEITGGTGAYDHTAYPYGDVVNIWYPKVRAILQAMNELSMTSRTPTHRPSGIST